MNNTKQDNTRLVTEMLDTNRDTLVDQLEGIIYAMGNAKRDYIKFDEYISNIESTITQYNTDERVWNSFK